ncbi:MAG TPA: tripartite tricarboxylate transporter substrate binding protein [Candidatus Avidesulfovibrio excrementigallinarum]|nr:tripartite tricarboxylate transporter substrate binding protein [Candidatus Avidesulfovibrio excrementigallinarum]
MRKMFSLICAALFAFGIVVSPAAAAWPDRAVRIIVPFNPGAGTDQQGRLVEKEFKEVFGQPLNFIYKPGADGAIGATELANSRPDGYTIGVYAFPLMVMGPLLGKGRYTPDSFDFLGISCKDVAVLVVPKDSPIKSFEDFVAKAKAEPGKMRVGVVEILGPTHITALKLQQQGVPMNIVPHAGGSKAMVAVLGGHIDALLAVTGASLNSASKLNFLAVASDGPEPLLPGVPTFKDKGYNIVSAFARVWLAPKGLPADVRERLSAGLKEIYAREDVKQRHDVAGIPVRFEEGEVLKQWINDFLPEAKQLVEMYNQQKAD